MFGIVNPELYNPQGSPTVPNTTQICRNATCGEVSWIGGEDCPFCGDRGTSISNVTEAIRRAYYFGGGPSFMNLSAAEDICPGEWESI